MDISKKAYEFVKRNKEEFRKKFSDVEVYPSRNIPATFFMAGCPGAGKTEFSIGMIKEVGVPIVRIDADEIRKIFPQFNGENIDELKRATVKGVEIIYDFILKKKMDAFVDGTFSSYESSYKNIERAVSKGREVGIFYIYQDPCVAWKFTKYREIEEGRKVPKEIFIDAYYKSKENVNKIKDDFGKKVTVYFIKKNYQDNSKIDSFEINIDDKYIPILECP